MSRDLDLLKSTPLESDAYTKLSWETEKELMGEPEKALSPIEVTVEGMVTEVSAEPKKAYASMVTNVLESAKVTEVISDSEKAELPIVVTLAGMAIVERLAP
jgi:hypothetical protein